MGLDLGQASDPTALAVLKRSPTGQRTRIGGPEYRYDCVELQRFPLGVSYPSIVRGVAALASRPELRPPHPPSGTLGVTDPGPPALAIDATGVGRAVVDQFLAGDVAATIVPITITGGHEVKVGRWNDTAHQAKWVPKADLVATVRILFDTKRLGIVSSLPLAETLKAELQAFKVRMTKAANESYGNDVREAPNDDLVLALALAAWLAESPRAATGGAFLAPCRLGKQVKDDLPMPGRSGAGKWW